MTSVWLLTVVLVVWLFCPARIKTYEGVPVPEVPSMFQAEILINVLHKKATSHAQVYFNSTSFEGSVIVDQPGMRMQMIYNFDAESNQTLLIKDNECYDASDSQSFIFSPDEDFSPGYMIGLAKNMSFYKKYNETLGVIADAFVADHLDYPAFHATNVSIESFWSDRQAAFNFPNCPHAKCDDWSVPLKTVVMGIINYTVIQTEYVFYNYRETNIETEAFQLPNGISCIGVKSRKPLPSLEYDFTTGSETVTSDGAGNIYTTLHYSSRMNVTKTEGAYPPGEIFSEYTFLEEIVDYNREVKYHINSATRECVRREKIPSIEEPKNLHKVYDFLSLDVLNIADAFYVGKKKIMDQECDQWTIGRNEPSMTSVTQIFLKSVKKKLSDEATILRWVPILINQTNTIMTGAEVEVEHVSRAYFNFQDELPNWNVFDVTPCYKEEYKKRFQIELKGEHIQVKQNPSSFVDAVRATIVDVAHIEPIRIQDLLLDYTMNSGEEYLIFTATLLEDTRNIPGEVYLANDEQAVNNDDAYDLIVDAVFRETFDVNYILSDIYPPFLYQGTSITDNILLPAPSKEIGLFKDTYKLQGAQDLQGSGYDYELLGESFYSCGTECLTDLQDLQNAQSFQRLGCESFAFCKYTGSCKISRLPFENITAEQKVNSSECSLYARSYLSDYTISHFRKVMPNEDEQAVQAEILSDEACARKCSLDSNNSLPFHCEGFNICWNSVATISTCQLRSRHILDIPPDTDIVNDKRCSYFSRDDFDDYLVHINQSLMSVSLDVVKLTSAKECAHMCTILANSGKKCESFEMCTNTEETGKSECHLLVYDKSDPNVKLVPNSECDYYSRREFPNHHHDIVSTTEPITSANVTSSSTALDSGNTEFTSPESLATEFTSPESLATEFTSPESLATEFTSPESLDTEFTSPESLATEFTSENGVTEFTLPENWTSDSTTSESNINEPRPGTKTSETTYAIGSMIGLGIGMVVLGFIIGSAAVIFYIRLSLRNFRTFR